MPACVEALAHEAELVAKVAWGDEPVAAVGESIEELGRVQCRLDLAVLLAVRSFECRGEHRAEGHASVVGWLQHHLRIKKGRAQRIGRLCRFLSNHPALEDGMRDGVLSFDHIEAIAEAYTVKYHEAWTAAFPHIVASAGRRRFEDVARDLQAFADSLCPRDAEERFGEQLAGRRFSKAGTIDGYGYLRGWMDPISYQIFAAEHDRVTEALFEQDWAFATELLGRKPDAVELADVTRTREQRSHDALVEMARRSRTLAGGAVAAAAEVVLHTTLETYEAAERHKATGEPLVVPDGGFCETDDGTPISPVAAVYAALDGQVRRIVFDAADEIISWGRARRAYTPTQAAALRAKYRRCTHPYGCDRNGPLLQTDHTREWQDGGSTDVATGTPMDGPHNRWKTNTRNQPPPPGRRDDGQRRGPPAWT